MEAIGTIMSFLPRRVYWWKSGSALGDKTQPGSTPQSELCFQKFWVSTRVADRKILPQRISLKGERISASRRHISDPLEGAASSPGNFQGVPQGGYL